MEVIELVGVAGVAVGTLVVGLVAHELSHAAVLQVLGVPFDVAVRPDRETSGIGARLLAPWATVTPRGFPPEVPAWGLRIASVAPLALTAPGVLVLAGVLPDPMASGNVFVAGATLAWLGCALPSPQDFSLFWYADRVLEAEIGLR